MRRRSPAGNGRRRSRRRGSYSRASGSNGRNVDPSDDRPPAVTRLNPVAPPASPASPASGSMAASMSASSSTCLGGDASSSSTITPQNGRIGRHAPVGSTIAGRPRARGDDHGPRRRHPARRPHARCDAPEELDGRVLALAEVGSSGDGQGREGVRRGRRRNREPDVQPDARRARPRGPARASPGRRHPTNCARKSGFASSIAAACARSAASSRPRVRIPAGSSSRRNARSGASSGAPSTISSTSER